MAERTVHLVNEVLPEVPVRGLLGGADGRATAATRAWKRPFEFPILAVYRHRMKHIMVRRELLNPKQRAEALAEAVVFRIDPA